MSSSSFWKWYKSSITDTYGSPNASACLVKELGIPQNGHLWHKFACEIFGMPPNGSCGVWSMGLKFWLWCPGWLWCPTWSRCDINLLFPSMLLFIAEPGIYRFIISAQCMRPGHVLLMVVCQFHLISAMAAVCLCVCLMSAVTTYLMKLNMTADQLQR